MDEVAQTEANASSELEIAEDLQSHRFEEVFARIDNLQVETAISSFELSVAHVLLEAVLISRTFSLDKPGWYGFCYGFRDVPGLKNPDKEDIKGALLHLIRWGMRHMRGWSDKRSSECHSVLLALLDDDADFLSVAEIANALRSAGIFRVKSRKALGVILPSSLVD